MTSIEEKGVCKESNLSQRILQTETSRARREEEIRLPIYQIIVIILITMMMTMRVMMRVMIYI